MPQAAGLAAELKSSLDVTLKLIPGGKGIFDVVVDGTKVFSKHDSDRFPQLGEVSKLIRKLQAVD